MQNLYINARGDETRRNETRPSLKNSTIFMTSSDELEFHIGEAINMLFPKWHFLTIISCHFFILSINSLKFKFLSILSVFYTFIIWCRIRILIELFDVIIDEWYAIHILFNGLLICFTSLYWTYIDVKTNSIESKATKVDNSTYLYHSPKRFVVSKNYINILHNTKLKQLSKNIVCF
jgi:hypothetical protein